MFWKKNKTVFKKMLTSAMKTVKYYHKPFKQYWLNYTGLNSINLKCKLKRSTHCISLILPLVHFQAAGIQQTLLQHLYQDLHVCAVFAGFPAVASLEAAVHRLSEASPRGICKLLTHYCSTGGSVFFYVCLEMSLL